MRIIIFFILIISPFSTFSNEEDILSLENLYIEKRCITCHVIGRGKFVGPDLYNVFNKYSDKEILQWIKNPQEIYKKYNKMPINEGYPPMPYMNVNSKDAGRLLEYIKRTKSLVKKNSKVSIGGSIRNFSTDKLLDNQEVELELLMADKIITKKIEVTKNGKFKFDKLKGNIAYRIKIFYDGIEYSTDKFYFLPRELEKKVDLIVYDSSQDIQNISINSSHLIISYDEKANMIVAAEIINVENKSRNIFIGTNPFGEKIRKINSYGVFPDIVNLGFPHRSQESFIVSDLSVIDTLPMPPGNRRLVLTYQKELDFFTTKLSRIFLNDVKKLTIIFPESKLSMSIEGLSFTKMESNLDEFAKDEYVTYSLTGIKEGDKLNLTFKKYDVFRDPKIIISIVFIFFMMGIFWYRKFTKSG